MSNLKQRSESARAPVRSNGPAAARGPRARHGVARRRTASAVSPAPWRSTSAGTTAGTCRRSLPAPAAGCWFRLRGVRLRGRRHGGSRRRPIDATSPEGRKPGEFRLEPYPTWQHATDAYAIERSLCLVRDRCSRSCATSTGASPRSPARAPAARLRVPPAQSETSDLDRIEARRGFLGAPPPYLPRLYLRGSSRHAHGPLWYRHFRTPRKRPAATTRFETPGAPRVGVDAPGRPGLRPLLDRRGGRGPGPLPRRGATAPGLPHAGPGFRQHRQPRRGLRGRRGPATRRSSRISLAGRSGARRSPPRPAQASGRFGGRPRLNASRGSATASCRVTSRARKATGLRSVDASLWFILTVDWFGRARATRSALPRCSAPCARSSRRIAAARGRHPRAAGQAARREPRAAP